MLLKSWEKRKDKAVALWQEKMSFLRRRILECVCRQRRRNESGNEEPEM
jgi:hypothetical protein